jgi:Secretion system C-terminal sorting domain
MKKFYLSLFVAACAITAAAQTTTRTLYWARGDQNWPNLANSSLWTNKANWSTNPASTINPSTDVTSGDLLIINGGNADITVTADMNITFTNLVIKVVGSGEITLNGGAEMNFTQPSVAISLSATTSNNGLTLNNGNSSNPTRILMNGVAKARNLAGSNAINISSSRHASGTQTIAATADGFDGFLLGVLPAVLSNFKASPAANKVTISWNTLQEVNTTAFVIERSNDGSNWQDIATIKAATNSSVQKNYQHTDNNPAKGINYYRLRIADADGNTEYSMVHATRLTASRNKITIFPNPAVNTANLLVDNDAASTYTIKIYNRNGLLVAQRKNNNTNNVTAIDVRNFAAGEYIVEVAFADGYKQTTQLMVSK